MLPLHWIRPSRTLSQLSSHFASDEEGIFNAMLPNAIQSRPFLSVPTWVLIVTVNLIGLVFGAAYAPVFELSAELTYPTPPGISAGLFLIFCNVILVGSLIPSASVSPPVLNISVFVLMVLAIVPLFFVTEKYPRYETDIGQDLQSEGDSLIPPNYEITTIT